MRCTPETIATALARIEAQGRTRRRALAAGAPESAVLDFCSNDYLGLARHPTPIAAMRGAALAHGVGARASHLLGGHGPQHAALERELAEFVRRPRALLFGSGYLANLAVLQAFADRHDLILQDRLNHASLLDAALLVRGARVERYRHADAADAAQRLVADEHAAFIVTDGVFSMDGDLAPLPELAALARARGAWLIVDDAHGCGVLGAEGRGSLEHFGLGTPEVPLLVGTLGKAFGSYGAFVAGEHDLIELLLQRARTYIYTTALPEPVAAATRAALRVAVDEPWRRAKALELAARFAERARRSGLPVAPSSTPIQPIVAGSNWAALALSAALLERGFRVIAVRPPTVPEGRARLRVTLSAAHEPDQVDALVEAIARCREEIDDSARA